jgi:Helicase conserved C-terminal domain
MSEYREVLARRIRSELFGPAEGAREVIAGKPYARYLCGVLFPVNAEADVLNVSSEPDSTGPPQADEDPDPAVAKAYDALPSTMGISFFVEGGTGLRVECEGGRYLPHETVKNKYMRHPLASADAPTVVRFVMPATNHNAMQQEVIWDGLARVVAVFRPRRAGWLVTIGLVNASRANSDKQSQEIDALLFQCRFTVHAEGGHIGEYPLRATQAIHPEEEELDVVYRRRKTFSIGHGCGAQWDAAKRPVTTVVAEPLPAYEVKGLTTDIALDAEAMSALNIQWLRDPATSTECLRAALLSFVRCYQEWIEQQRRDAEGLSESMAPAVARILKRQTEALARMRAGVDVLFSKDPNILQAFVLAQEAMLRQFLYGARRAAPKDLGAGDTSPINTAAPDVGRFRWRPFQLAFQLLVLESLANEDSAHREKLDLLWFPTGGGKTEAYLALAAFEIILRRLRHGEAGAGTAVIMRYTLRLLTSQQFERAATLISVLEVMRKADPKRLGKTGVRLGLWVGGATSPNQLDSDNGAAKGAKQLVQDMLDAKKPENAFILRACPFCSTRIVPVVQAPRSAYGLDATSSSFRMFCPDESCVLHPLIPVTVVDEDLFNDPPTMIIGTIDKFARLVWDTSACGFFMDERRLPPSLILQDELHLITGPLGTIAGLYEAGIETLINSRSVHKPKYVAATATIQRAAEQCRLLYARDAAVFPPPGLDAADSFFSREDSEAPGRMFVGIMGNGLYSSLTSLIQVSAAAAAASGAVSADDSKVRDSYWTQVIYHNSRQELGKTTTMLRDDVRTRLEVIEMDSQRRRAFDRIEELSANVKGNQISEALERLQVEWPSPDAVDAVACTNMISVGVDIARLGLMIMKGQPKATAEYIQATSRVGRDRKRPPGVVLTLYSSVKPRDRSHYEGFQSYHDRLYRVVEPVTVTPYALPARERALHAALVLLMRHAMGWKEPRDAGLFNPADNRQEALIAALRVRVGAACEEDERSEAQEHLDRLVEQWRVAAASNASNTKPITFTDAKQFRSLLVHFPSDGDNVDGIWPTLNSMRHVDGEVAIAVMGV